MVLELIGQPTRGEHEDLMIYDCTVGRIAAVFRLHPIFINSLVKLSSFSVLDKSVIERDIPRRNFVFILILQIFSVEFEESMKGLGTV